LCRSFATRAYSLLLDQGAAGVEPDPAGAIKGDRRDHFEAETDLWEIVTRIAACQWPFQFSPLVAAPSSRMSAEWRAEQDRCLREIERHQSADQSCLEEGVRLLELAPQCAAAFLRSKNRAKNVVCSISLFRTARGRRANWTLSCGGPLIAETTAIATQAACRRRPNLAKSEIWLPAAFD
jgi:hypothetical protein